MADIADTLAERGQRYGKFTGHAHVSQSIQRIMTTHDEAKWGSMDTDQKEALFMIAHKIARIINGDPDHADSWLDIAGYAKLVADRLEEEETKGV